MNNYPAAPSPTVRAFVSSLLTGISAVPIGIWTDIYGQNKTSDTTISDAIFDMGGDNWYLIVGALIIGTTIGLLVYWDQREREWTRRIEFWRARRNVNFQLKLLRSYCEFITKELGVKVSARCFDARYERNDRGETEARLYQIRDLHIENEIFAQETAFTYIRVDDANFVSSNSFRIRAPIYEVLEENHMDRYTEREKNMVEPSQRWVLSAPILRLTVANRASDDLEPKGVIVFYGTSVPNVAADRISEAKRLCRDVAEIYSSTPLTEDDLESSKV